MRHDLLERLNALRRLRRFVASSPIEQLFDLGPCNPTDPSYVSDYVRCVRVRNTVFRRGAAKPRIPRRDRETGGDRLPGPLAAQVERIVEAVGGDDRAWWTQCVRRLGAGPIDRALGQLRESRRASRVRNPGGLLTKILKDLAAEAGVLLRVVR